MQKATRGWLCYADLMDYIDWMLLKFFVVCLLAFIGGLLGFFNGKE